MKYRCVNVISSSYDFHMFFFFIIIILIDFIRKKKTTNNNKKNTTLEMDRDQTESRYENAMSSAPQTLNLAYVFFILCFRVQNR